MGLPGWGPGFAFAGSLAPARCIGLRVSRALRRELARAVAAGETAGVT